MDFNNYLIQGALSCGKTYEAKRLACCAVGLLNKDDKLDENLFKENVGPEKQIEYVPVHEEYEYSSFIQGIEVESENGRMIYRPIDRVFVDICNRASGDSGNNYAIILDDIDRVNIMKVFGELLYAIENRGEEITLQSGTKLAVPENLTIIATMTSVMQHNKPDYAFLRRFKQIELFSDVFVIDNLIADGACVSEAKDEYEKYNNFIIQYLVDDLKKYERYYLLGHGWFITNSKIRLERKIYYQIIPLIEEYLKTGVLICDKAVFELLKRNCLTGISNQASQQVIEIVDKKDGFVSNFSFNDFVSQLKVYLKKVEDFDQGKIKEKGCAKRVVEGVFHLTLTSELMGTEQMLFEMYSVHIGNLGNKPVPIFISGDDRKKHSFGGGHYVGETPKESQNYSESIINGKKVYYRMNNSDYYILNSAVIKNKMSKTTINKSDNFGAVESSVDFIKLCYIYIYLYYKAYLKAIEWKIKIATNDNLQKLYRIIKFEMRELKKMVDKAHDIPSFRSKISDLVLLNYKKDDIVSKKIKCITLNAKLEGVYKMDSKDYKYIMDTLNIRQMILQGPPGTSKTYGAKEFLCKEADIADVNGKLNETALKGLQITAEEYEKAENGILTVDQDRKLYWDIVQFHPSYGYEDFVRGITVTPVDTASEILTGEINQEAGGKSIVSVSAPKTGIRYETVNKTLGKIAKLAKSVGDKPVYLIIDEINRANVSTVFGELIYALEYRGEAVATPYKVAGESNIELPENLYIIGTMNTADKSIGNIDYAVRRRFLFFPMLPDIKVVEKHVNGKSYSEKVINLFNTVAGLFDTNLNEDFNKDDVQVGHTMFLVDSEEEMKLRFEYQILPILREYYKDGVLIDNGNGDEKSKKIMEYLEKFGKSTPMEISELNAILFDEDRVTDDE